MKKIEIVLVIVCIVSFIVDYFMKGLFSILSTTLISIFYFGFSWKLFLTKENYSSIWLAIMAGWVFSIDFISLLFIFNNFPGKDIISLCAFLITIVMILLILALKPYNKDKIAIYNPILKRLVIAWIVFPIIYWLPKFASHS